MSQYPGDQWVVEFQNEVQTRYNQAGQSLDLSNVVWAGRALFDIGNGLAPEISKTKHLTELEHELGLNPSFPAPTRLHAEGRMFVNEAGQAVPLRSQSFFLGLLRHAIGQDVRPAMRYARDVAGSNCLRTFVLMHYIPAALGLPDITGEVTEAALHSYLDLAAAEGMYVDLTAGDAQVVMPTLIAQMRFFQTVRDVMAQHPNAALLSLNEPWKNGLDPFNSLNFAQGVLRSRGSAQDENQQYQPPLEVYTPHTERNLGDEGYRWVRHQWEMHNYQDRPVYLEEPIGCAEEMIDGKRDNSPHRFSQGAVVGEITGAGWCFHPEYGIRAEMPIPGSKQDLCAMAVGNARNWFKPEAQRWTQTRAGLADSALVLDDAHALRVYMRLGQHEGQAVAVHPVNYTAVARNGWHVVQQQGAFIDLAR